MTTTFLILNIVLALFAIGAVLGLITLAHRVPSSAPMSDESWGRDDQWVPSDPLPFRQLTVHEQDRETRRAA
jgi:hypothetical protein